jgi:peptide/nickel transport system permease protein
MTWTGSVGPWLDPSLWIAAVAFGVALIVNLLLGLLVRAPELQVNPDGTLSVRTGPRIVADLAVKATGALLALVLLAYLAAGVALPWGEAGIVGAVARRFLPVWIALALTFAVSIAYKRKLGLYGKLFDSRVGMVGLRWSCSGSTRPVHRSLRLIATHDPLTAISGLKNKPSRHPRSGARGLRARLALPSGRGQSCTGRVLPHGFTAPGSWSRTPPCHHLLLHGGHHAGPAGRLYGGRLDTCLSFLANLILAFPVILRFYLLVTPEIVSPASPPSGQGLFLFPIVFVVVLLWSRYHTQRDKAVPMVAVAVALLGALYLSLVSQPGTPVNFLGPLDLFNVPSGILVVFVSVVFVNAPTVFRIVRGLAMDIKTRDYVAAAQTRGEKPWYIMLWEILPNARGPLIVDFCLRIGYTTILLGTLGFFGLGLPPDSPDWGSTINAGRQLLSIYPHPALVPAVALLSLVLGLNLLADGLREESLKD